MMRTILIFLSLNLLLITVSLVRAEDQKTAFIELGTFSVITIPQANQQMGIELMDTQIFETEWRQTAHGESVGLHRYFKKDSKPHAVLFYLPGTNMNGVLKTREPDKNLWLYLAAAGIDVYALDYRTRFVSHDYAGDQSFIKNWTIERFVADALAAVTLIEARHDGSPLFVAGFSRGVTYAYALVGQHKFSGLVALDGGFKGRSDESFDYAAELKKFNEGNRYASEVSRRGHAARTKLMQSVIDDPAGSSMDARYATTGEHLRQTLHHAWGAGVLTNVLGGVTDISTLATEMLGYDWFFPLIQNIQGTSIASQLDDPNTMLDDHYGAMSLPILAFASGNFGEGMLSSTVYSAKNSGSKDVTILKLEGYGHLDVLFADNAVKDVYQVVRKWIEKRAAKQKINKQWDRINQ
jgi:hypothetical protein